MERKKREIGVSISYAIGVFCVTFFRRIWSCSYYLEFNNCAPELIHTNKFTENFKSLNNNTDLYMTVLITCTFFLTQLAKKFFLLSFFCAKLCWIKILQIFDLGFFWNICKIW